MKKVKERVMITFWITNVGEGGFVGDQLSTSLDTLLDQRPFIIELTSESSEIILYHNHKINK